MALQWLQWLHGAMVRWCGMPIAGSRPPSRPRSHAALVAVLRRHSRAAVKYQCSSVTMDRDLLFTRTRAIEGVCGGQNRMVKLRNGPGAAWGHK
jgi:hypothetical protein